MGGWGDCLFSFTMFQTAVLYFFDLTLGIDRASCDPGERTGISS